MTNDEINRLTRSLSRVPADMVQDDIWGTNLPNGMLLWFGFDFAWADLPSDPVLHRGDPPKWIGTPPGFTFKIGISDAKVTIETDEFQESDDAEEREATHVTPKGYTVTIQAHGLDRADVFTCPDWHKVQQRCRSVEDQLDESHMERHHSCEDANGNLTPEACLFCERGMAGG